MSENLEIMSGSVSGSIVEAFGLPTPNDITVKGGERVIAVLARKVDELSKELYEVKKERLLKETHLPMEVLKHMGLPTKPPSRLLRGHGYRPLLAHEIIQTKKEIIAEKGYFNESMVARRLNVNFRTYKKYARLYGIWEPKPNVKDVRNLYDPELGKHPLSEILEGKHPNCSIYSIKDKLIRSKIKEPQCELCGFKERRITDGKVPLIINFMDGNSKNHKLENIKLYCYNCTFTSGKGYIRGRPHYFDPDWLQDREKEFVDEPVRW